MSKKRKLTWPVLIVLPFGLLLAAVVGHFAYIAITMTPLHPNPDEVPSVSARAPAANWAGSVEQARGIVRAALAEQNLPGLSVAVGIDRDIVWAEGFGWANIETRAPVSPEMRFRTGSASMMLTSAAVGLLVQDGRLKLDDEIQTYVPAFPKKQWPVTLGELMAHVAGVREDSGDEEPLSDRCEQTVDGLPRFSERPLLFEPGTQYRFSNYGWILTSAAVEAAAHQRFFTFMREQIFEPLHMDNTVPDLSMEPLQNRATFYYPRFAGNPRYGPEPAREGDYSCFAGAGGFLSTPSDLVRYGMAVNGGTLLRPDTVKVLQTPQRLASGQETGYGLGWDLETVSIAGEPTRQVGHDGEFFIGGSTSFIMFPGLGPGQTSRQTIVVAVMTNISFADTSAVASKIARAFADQQKTPVGK